MIQAGKPIPEELQEVFDKYLSTDKDVNAVVDRVNGARKITTVRKIISGQKLNEGTAFVAQKMAEYTAEKIAETHTDLRRDLKRLKKYI